MGAEHDIGWETVDETSSTGSAAREQLPIQGRALACPRPVVDALVEVAWAFPGLRISYARRTGPRELTFMGSAGSRKTQGLSGEVLNLQDSPRVARLLSQAHAVGIEDASVDSRMPQVPALFDERRMASSLIMPIHGAANNQWIGAVMFDAPHPRTWSSREEVALENLTPLLQLALENVALKETLDSSIERAQAVDRQRSAIRGVVDAAVHDSRVLVDALLEVTQTGGRPAPVKDAAGAIERQLFDVLADLVALPDRISARRDRENIDLNELVVAAAPVLRAVLGSKFRLFVRTDPMPVWVRANRTGLDRLIRTLVVHATALGTGHDVGVRAYASANGATIEISGDALGTDDRLLSIVSDQPQLSPNEVGIDLWQARCEALLCGAAIRYRVDADGTKLLIEMPTQASAPTGA